MLKWIRDAATVILIASLAATAALWARDSYLRSERCARGWELVDRIQQFLKPADTFFDVTAPSTGNPLLDFIQRNRAANQFGVDYKSYEDLKSLLAALIQTLQDQCGSRPTLPVGTPGSSGT